MLKNEKLEIETKFNLLKSVITKASYLFLKL